MFKFLKNQKGQISIMELIGIGAGILIAGIGGFVAQNNYTASKIDNVNVEISSTNQRTAKLEEAIETLKQNNIDIKADIKEILKILK